MSRVVFSLGVVLLFCAAFSEHLSHDIPKATLMVGWAAASFAMSAAARNRDL
jgi:hypothetical protein